MTNSSAAPYGFTALVLQDHVQRMNDARDEAEQGKQDIQPEMPLQPDLQKHTEWRQNDGEKDLDRIRGGEGDDGSFLARLIGSRSR